MDAEDAEDAEDADIIARAVGLLLSGRPDEGCRELSGLSAKDPISSPFVAGTVDVDRVHTAQREPLTTSMRAAVYERDGWRCRYCRRKLVLPLVLELLTPLCPGFKGLLPGHHMPARNTEPAVERVYPNVDHVHAVSRGGSWRDATNHVTACTPCNTRKSNRTGWLPTAAVHDSWDGLTGSARALADLAGGTLTGSQRDWLKALRL